MEISSPEFTEWQAYYEMEPFGDVVADMRHGVATALQANIHFVSKDKHYKADDFIHWRDTGKVDESEPVLLDDPVAQSNLMRASMFGRAPEG